MEEEKEGKGKQTVSQTGSNKEKQKRGGAGEQKRREAGKKHQANQEGQQKKKGGGETNSAKAQDTNGWIPAEARNNKKNNGKKANTPTRRGNACPEGAKQSRRTKRPKER